VTNQDQSSQQASKNKIPPSQGSQPKTEDQPETGGLYAKYVLAVLTLVYVFNFIDRNILAILAQEIKADLQLSDAQLGFLYGTAFAVFYAVFGIPLGRLADIWVRRKLIAIGLAFWSLMTALSGTARSFFSLAGYRIGVGVGESSASPAAFSMLGDYFPPRLRATAVAVYSSGIYVGAGIGVFLGGWVIDGWHALYPTGEAPFGLQAWQAALFLVGLPGLLAAIWVATLREPVRGQSEGLTSAAPHPHPFRELGRELVSVVPPLTLLGLRLAGAGVSALVFNIVAGGGLALIAWALIAWLGSPAQWISLAIGLYAFLSWMQRLALRDRPAFVTIFHSRALVYGIIGFSWIGFITYGFGFWAAPFFIRVHEVSAGQTGTVLGLAAAIGGWIGVNAGGVLSDWLKTKTPLGRVLLGYLTIALATPVGIGFLMTQNLQLAYGLYFVFMILSPMWIGPVVATANELVLPRMRGTSSAFYILCVTFIGLALGPYTIGQLSDVFIAAELDSGDALRNGMLIAFSAWVVALLFLYLAGRHVERDEAGRLERARAAGEPGLESTGEREH
jgi:MFS family permease